MIDIAELLLEFSARIGTSGVEDEVADFSASLLKGYGAVERTPLGSILCCVSPPQDGKPHILLDAHMDEISMVVTGIEDKGFLQVSACGGIDRRILLSARVLVHSRSGPIQGVVCTIPPHLNADDKTNKKVEEIYIDIGRDKEQAQADIALGDRITMASYPRRLLGRQVSGKALDDRAGCVSLLRALDDLATTPADCGLTVMFSSMEEVGGQGAKTAAYAVNPTHAIVVDVSFAHTPDAPKERCGLIGKGPMIGFAPVLSRRLSQRLIALAEENDFPCQTEVMGKSTGTNADCIATTRCGVKTALVSIPQKYMHMPVEVVDVDDVDYTGRLIAALVRDIAQGGEQ